MIRILILLVLGLSVALARESPAARQFKINGVRLELLGVSDGMKNEARLVMEKQVTISGDTAVSPPLADDLAFFLLQHYFQLGYADARVDWRVAEPKAVLEVKEGPKYTVGGIDFTGVEASVAETLRPYLTRQTKEREGRLAKALPFVVADLEAGQGLVVRRLQADGYLQATAGELVFEKLEGGGGVTISLELTPGPLSVFGGVEIRGDAGPLTGDVRKKITDLSGQPYSEVRLENVRKEVKGDLEARGFFAAEVKAESSPGEKPGGDIAAVLTIQPGKIFTVSEVRTAPGLSLGGRRKANAILRTSVGARYNPEFIDLEYRRAMDTGIYSRLNLEAVATGPDTLALSLEGEEAKPKTLGFFGGFETFYGLIAGVEARHVNFMDTGNALGLRAELRGTGANGSFQWSDPAFLDSRNALSLLLGAENFTFKDYSRTTYSARGALTRRFTRRITAEVFSGFSLNTSESDVLTDDELGPEDYRLLTVGGRLTADYRDNPLNPRSGWLAGASVEGGYDQGGREGLNYVKNQFNAAWYYPFSKSWRMAVGARAAALKSGGGVEQLPIDLRLFNGGSTSVRSFAEREMGPQSGRGSTPLGGTAMTVMNAELSYEIISNLEVAGFVDAGSLSREEGSLFDLDRVRYAVGMGVRYQLPIGPLRVDYGYNPDRQEGEAAGALHLTFGFAF